MTMWYNYDYSIEYRLFARFEAAKPFATKTEVMMAVDKKAAAVDVDHS